MTVVLNFALYLAAACALLCTFMGTYVKVTPYNEFKEIANNNVAAAVAFCGAILGFTFPLLSAIYFTHSFVEMLKWSVITEVVQLGVFVALRKSAGKIEAGNIAPALLLATLSLAVGLLNAVCISY